MTSVFKLENANKIPNNTVLALGIRYGDRPDQSKDETRGRTNPKVYTYGLLKTGGLWYMTGSGKVPQAAGWGAVERWLEREGRVVEWVKVASEMTVLYEVTEAEEVLPELTADPREDWSPGSYSSRG